MLYILILLPLLVGLLCGFGRLGEKHGHTVVLTAIQAIITAVALFCCFSGIEYATTAWQLTDSIRFSLALDGVGKLFVLIITVAWLFTLPYAGEYMSHGEHKGRFYAFLFLTEAAMLGASCSGDFMTLYLFYEMTTLLSFPLVLHDQNRASLVGAGKYLYYSVGGAFLALFGLVVLQAGGVSLTFYAGGHVDTASPMVLLGAFCMILGFGAKAGMYPLHNWLPSAHPAAPAPASALLSGVIAKAGILCVMRTVYSVVGADALAGTWVQTVCLTLSLITVAMGSFMGCMEKVLKKRLAYSSISQISYIMVGIFLLSSAGSMGAQLQLVFHAAAKVGLFLCVGSIIHLSGATRSDELYGMGKKLPITMVAFTLLSLSLVGIPPFGGFMSKWYLGTAALSAVPGVLAYLTPAVLLLSAFLTAGYLFAPAIAAFFPGKKAAEGSLEHIHEPKAMVIPLLVMAALCFVSGAFPGIINALLIALFY